MPHCWPQKQQWVLTSRSGSMLVDSRAPVIADRCGPKRSMMRTGSTGISATTATLPLVGTAVHVLPPERALRQPEERAPAPGADLLIVPAARQLVPESKLLLDGDEVANHGHRRVGLPAATTRRLLAARTRVLVEADAE